MESQEISLDLLENINYCRVVVRITQIKVVSALCKRGQLNIVVHMPTSESGKRELAQRVSDVHARAVNHRLKSLNCPEQQKLALLNAIIETKKEKNKGE